MAVVERAPRRGQLVHGGQGRDRSHVAGAPGAARPADPPAQSAASDGPRPPGAGATASQPRRGRAAVHRSGQVQGGQRQPGTRRRRPPAGLRFRATGRADARQRHGGAPRGRRVRDLGRGHRQRRRGAGAGRTGAGRAGEAVPAGLGRGGDTRERGDLGLAPPRRRPRDHAARGRRGDVPGQGHRRSPPGAVRRAAAPCS